MVEISEISEESETGTQKKPDNVDKKPTLDGAPQLPPGMADFAGKSADKMLEELRSTPFFMENYDQKKDLGDNSQLEALKALQAEEKPSDRADHLRSRGNDFYRQTNYKEAIKCYTEGINVKCGMNYVDAALYLNRAACNLMLKNYRKCIDDCEECLKLQPKNLKAFYRIGNAYFKIEKYDQAEIALKTAFSIDKKSKAVRSLLAKVQDKKQKIKKAKEEKEKMLLEKKEKEDNVKKALKIRNYTSISTTLPEDVPDSSELHLEDPKDCRSQLIMPAVILYPTTNEFDFVGEVSELSTPLQLTEMLMDRPEEYFNDGKHQNFRPKKLATYLESNSGGMIKVGKKVMFSNALSKAPLFDGILRVYIVPKVDSEKWLSSWDKKKALSRRSNN